MAPYKIVFAPLAYVLSEEQAARIRSFVQKGGVFVTNFRLGVKDESSQIVRTPLPGLLRDVMGVTVEDYVPIYSAKQSVKFSSLLAGPDGECGIWADVLQPSGAEVLGSFTTGAHAGQAAVTMNSYGKGKAVYIGVDLDTASLARVLRAFSALAGVKQPLDVPLGVEMTVRKSGDKQWIFLLNHTSALQTVSILGSFADLLTKETYAGKIQLSAYGVRVLQAALHLSLDRSGFRTAIWFWIGWPRSCRCLRGW
jgi:beta-galactosidase